MMLEPPNRIHNAELNFKFNTSQSNVLSGNDFVAWAKTNILEIIDEVASGLTTAGMVVQIPEINIHIDLSVEKNAFATGDQVKRNIREQIEVSLKKAIQENSKNEITKAAASAEIVMDYIIKGQVERQVSDAEWNDLVTDFYNELVVNKEVYSRWVQTLNHPDAFIRFFRLKSLIEQQQFLQEFTLEKNVALRLTASLRLFNANPDYFLSIPLINFYELVFQLLPDFHWSLSRVLQEVIIQRMIPEKIAIKNVTVPKVIHQEVKRVLGKKASYAQIDRLGTKPFIDQSGKTQLSLITKNDAVEFIEEGAYVGQAGLVLLAIFLPQFLKNSGYLNTKGKLINANEIPILLHYMATGEIEVPEWKLTLPKIMSGLSPGQHCNTALKPTKKLKIQIEELFNAIIGHWKAIKNTSADGFRETFLIRDGVLKSKNGYYYLNIEEHTVDILLNYVSWNYTTVKLNWMKSILFVEWNKS